MKSTTRRPRPGDSTPGFRLCLAAASAILVACAPATTSPPPEPSALPEGWIETVLEIRWVDYNPSQGYADDLHWPDEESMAEDFATLRSAGFTGIVTYGPPTTSALEAMESMGFEGVIVGVWDPTRAEELELAEAAAASPIVLGYCIGNEGIMFDTYTVADLEDAARRLDDTGLPYTTTETGEQYRTNPELLAFGDWLFPNLHPFHSRVLDPDLAVEWTEDLYDDLASRTDLFVMAKETGLPHGGVDGVSERNQLDFYVGLAETDVPFAYFEGFDVEWKDWAPHEPYWGVFRKDRSPTLLGEYLMGLE